MALDPQKPVSLWLVPIIGLGFATTQLSWALFNIAVPLFLQDTYNLPRALIGFVMTWDNIIAFFVQPYIGTRSDNTRTRFGRRLPYIIPGIIFGAALFMLIPLASEFPIYVFLASIVIFNLAMALYRSPSVSLMPDLIEPERRSAGNGIVNLMGGAFSGASLFIAGGLLKAGNTIGAFAFVSVGMILSLIILVSIVREPQLSDPASTDGKLLYSDTDPETKIEHDSPSALTQIRNEVGMIVSSSDKSYLFMLLAILSWFMAWNAIEAFYSIYVAEKFLPTIDPFEAGGEASQVLFIFPIIFVVFTLVGGILGTRIGRLRTMRIGLIFFTLAIAVGSFVQVDSVFGLDMGWRSSYRIIFIIAGAAWGLINVNSIVVIWHHATDNGAGTGIYYAFASAAAILGPTLVGPLMDVNVQLLFTFSLSFLILANVFLFFVRTGEAEDESIGKSNENADALAEMID